MFDQIDSAGSSRPSNIWSGDDEAREVVERLIRAAGYDPVYIGPLDKAGAQEDAMQFWFAINHAGLGAFFYRFAAPGEL